MATRTPARPRPTGRRPTSDEMRAADMVQRSGLELRNARLRKSARGPDGNIFDEVGTTGLRQYGGFVLEEWLRQLQGRKAAWAWREMMDNSPIVGAILFAFEFLCRGVEWRVEPGNDPAAAEFVEECMHDMSHTWADFVCEWLSMMPYGWALMETIYKRRNGEQAERPFSAALDTTTGGMPSDTQEDDSNPASSKYKDGKIGWRKMPVRAQETLLRWHFDGYSGIRAMEQIDWHGGSHVIPIEKALLFRSRPRRNNPEGYSCLRNAYVPHFRLKNIETTESVGIERDLAGIPVMEAPEGVDINSPANANVLQKAIDLVTSLRRDEYEGIVHNFGWKLTLLSSGGTRQINTDDVIRRYEQRIATSMLADFILIGQDAVGSFAMVDVKSDLFGMVIDGIMQLGCDVINRYGVPRLLKLNGMDTSEPPQIKASSAGRIDLDKVGTFFSSIALAGARIPWSEELLKALFSEAGLPANFEEQKMLPQDPDNSPEMQHAVDLAGRKEQRSQNEQAWDAGDALPNPEPGQQPQQQKPQPAQPLKKAETHSGVMVALYPETKVARKLAVTGGEAQHELHMTLTYHGHVNDLRNPGGLVQTVRRWAESTPPLSGRTSGVGKFTDGEPCTYASCDMPRLEQHRQRLVDHLERAGFSPSHAHGYTPHITLAYDQRHRAHPDPQPLDFDHVTVKIGDERHDIPLMGVQKDQPTPSQVHVDDLSAGAGKPKPKRRKPDEEVDESDA